MIGHGVGGGGGLGSKTLYSKIQFAMACIRVLVMSAYKVINCLISQPKHTYILSTEF